MDRVVVHLDMDAYYASCEEARRPDLRGRPVVVGADPRRGAGRGVVVAANYAARALGVGSAMPIREAWMKAPNAAYVKPDHAYYSEVGRRIFDDLRSTFTMDRVSIDEAFLDASALTDFDAAPEFARGLHERVAKTSGGLTCSVGVAPNRLVAKVASGRRKPNGTAVVPPAEVQAFLDRLPVGEIPYIGPKTNRRLAELGIATAWDLREQPLNELLRTFGSHGAYMFEASRGIDDTPVGFGGRIPRSISHERTLEEDTRDRHRLFRTIRRMMDDLEESLAEERAWYRTVAVKVRFSDFTTLTRQASLLRPTSNTDAARRFVPRLLAPLLEDARRVRLVGLRLGTLSENGAQRTLGDYAPG